MISRERCAIFVLFAFHPTGKVRFLVKPCGTRFSALSRPLIIDSEVS